MRKATNHEILAVLDSAILTQSGYTSTFDADNGTTIKSFVPTFSDSVYISVEGIRKNSANDYEIAMDANYNDDPFSYEENEEVFPVFKQAGNDPSPSDGSERLISVSVVPNPFEKRTMVSVDVPRDIPLSISVFDVLGKNIATLYSGISESEHYSFYLEGNAISPGVYFIRIQAGNQVETRKVEMIR
jgi:hypothetical protein